MYSNGTGLDRSTDHGLRLTPQAPQMPTSPAFTYPVLLLAQVSLRHDQLLGSFRRSRTCEQAMQVALSRGFSSEQMGHPTVVIVGELGMVSGAGACPARVGC